MNLLKGLIIFIPLYILVSFAVVWVTEDTYAINIYEAMDIVLVGFLIIGLKEWANQIMEYYGRKAGKEWLDKKR